MKKITILLALIFTSVVSAQQVVVQNFETPSSYNLNSFAGLSGSVQPDPAPGASRINSLRLISTSTGEVYQGCELIQLANKIKLTTDKTVSIDVYSTQVFTLLAKAENGSGAPNSGASQTYTTPNVWQTLTFTFTQGLDNTTTANGSYSSLTLFPNWSATNTGFNSPANFTLYIDNITSEATPIAAELVPTTAAPTPPNRPSADVKSLFSNAYTPITTFNYAGADGQPSNDNTYNTSWCPGNTSLIQVQGNDTNKITGLGCEGVAFLAARFGVGDFTRFHIDIWTPTATQNKVFNLKFSNWSGGSGETNAFEYSGNNSNILTSGSEGTWISIDIPIASFNPVGGTNNTDFAQFIITSDLGTVYYDNLYLHKNTLGNSSFDLAKFSMYPNPSSNNLTIDIAGVIDTISILNTLGQEVMRTAGSSNSETIDVSNLQSGIYIVKVSSEGASATQKFIKK